MLKASTRTTVEVPNMHTKCGEIHYLVGNWNYVCVFCGFISRSHDDFRDHLKLNHFSELMYRKIPCLEDNATDVKSSKRKSEKSNLDDPLHLSRIDAENASIVEPTETFDLQNDIMVHGLDNSNLSCDFQTNVFENMPDMNSINERKDTPLFDENSIETDSLSEYASQKGTDIDWDTPFKPTYLKNSEKRPYRPRKQPFACTYCGRTFRRRYQYDTHLNIHTGAKPHQCEVCGRQFRAIATLQRHLTTHEQRYFVCSFCNKSFSHRPACLSHEKRHTQERNEPCDLCDKRFYTMNQLDTHKRRVHKKSINELPFACDLCPKRYRTTSMLSIHRSRIHYKTAEFQCEKCEKKFVDLERLVGHKKIHVVGKISTQFLNVTRNS